MPETLSFLFISGLLTGLSAGFSPGPLTSLVISHSVMHGRREGIRTALAPLISDGPIILVAVFAIESMSGTEWFLGAVSLAGGLLLFRYGYESLRFRHTELTADIPRGHSLRKGISVNLLNPHPYLFWFTVGGPLLVRSYPEGPAGPVAFLGGFYGTLVGSKILLAVVSGLALKRYRGIMIWTNRALGLALWILGMALVLEGMKFLWP